MDFFFQPTQIVASTIPRSMTLECEASTNIR